MDDENIELTSFSILKESNRNKIDSIIKYCDDAFENPVSKRPYYSDLLDKISTKSIFLYAYKKQVLGYCSFYANDEDSKTGYISLLAIKQNFQNQHIGSYLLNNCLDVIKSKKFISCSLEVNKDNESGIRFYKKNGFIFLEDKTNSIIMNKKL